MASSERFRATERDSSLVAPLLHAKIKSLSEELERAEGERLSAFDRMKEVEERARCRLLSSSLVVLLWRRKGRRWHWMKSRPLRFTGVVIKSPWRRRLGKWSKRPSRS
ncbi:hypothetical protein PIB30_064311 [Stylosanthes scabra]|uniref:Uncharacterized protein n=1 Tax=Stylosanthes scabra TaxID=79078 RepID=A0ABU6RLZ1_9FABA|nr:hypothetical protein [Stylosanthes scabra]